MRRIIFFFLIVFSLTAFPRAGYSQKNKPKKADIVKRLFKADSVIVGVNTASITVIDSPPPPPPAIDSESIALNNRNLDEFLQVQKERNAKQKKAAFIRIGIGVAMLIVLVIGMARRRKQKEINS